MSDLDTHREALAPLLAKHAKGGILNLIDGQSLPARSGATFATHSPVDDSFIADVARSDAADIDAAAKAAKKAFPAWAALGGEARKKLLHKIADLIVERADEIALCECWDTGQAYKFMSKAALRGADNFRFFADMAPAARFTTDTQRPCPLWGLLSCHKHSTPSPLRGVFCSQSAHHQPAICSIRNLYPYQGPFYGL